MRLLVTRPAEPGEKLIAALAARGHQGLLQPVLESQPVEAKVPALAAFAALAFTSQQAVARFAALTKERKLPTFAVGRATAKALQDAGFRQVVSAEGDSLALAQKIAQQLPKGTRLLYPCGQDRAGDLVGELAARGLVAEPLVLYRTKVIAALDPAVVAALKKGAIDGVLFFSPKTAAGFVTLVGAAGLLGACQKLDAFVLSPAIAEAAAKVTWRRMIIAKRPDAAALLDAIDGI